MAAQREWFEKDYYKVLGVVPTASDKEITRAYRKLAKEHHPDANPGSEERFKEISAAYDVLGDAEKRKEYDEVRAHGPVGGFGGAPGWRRHLPHGGHGRPERPLRGPLRGAAAARARPSAGPSAAPTWRRSSTCRSRTRCTASPRRSTCPRRCAARTAAAAGRRRAPRRTPARAAGGPGASTTTRGCSPSARSARTAWAAGTLFDTPCPVCHGTGTEQKVRSVKVRIPAGVEDGQRIRVKGRGAPGQGMAPPGDLYVVVHVAQPRRSSGAAGAT